MLFVCSTGSEGEWKRKQRFFSSTKKMKSILLKLMIIWETHPPVPTTSRISSHLKTAFPKIFSKTFFYFKINIFMRNNNIFFWLCFLLLSISFWHKIIFSYNNRRKPNEKVIFRLLWLSLSIIMLVMLNINVSKISFILLYLQFFKLYFIRQ